ncbi:hypothetical protein [Sphingosinicella sp. BN140058]|uniref:hypothetical protein n=1 Tax=Sphingosinicella sp. BN140058 TaxID=1892855 RepID=UPI0010111CFB|nr:hypothetical protein [Sphingosinicella sp. BN140058]QAY78145.1 hypothetical protein ETR14_17640 [Sphingosinicella sp. BN140058]
MAYIPIRLLRPSKVPDVKGPAIVFPLIGRDQGTMLVTGGEMPHVCFLEGTYVGEGFEQAKAGRWEGLALEHIEIEVDQTAQFRPALIRQPLGSIIRTGSSLEVIISIKDGHGFDTAARIPIEGTAAEERELEVGFTKWRAVINEAAERRVIFTYTSEKTADM